tara:strand:+ start:382 stop:798 length:417 start_codon:yes stop_codon:yes gene_type:complete
MRKQIDWQIKFDKFIEANMEKPFEWGKWDCCLFSDACIKAMTGQSLIPKELVWKDKESALQTITDYGITLKNAIAKASKRKDLEKVDLNYLQKGDLIVMEQDGNNVCGIFNGAKTLGVNEEGIVVLKDFKIIEAWRIN